VHEFREADQDDRLFIYFAGHGEVVIDHIGNEIGYLVAHDSDSSKEFTCISIANLLELRNFTPAKHVGFVFDSCFSGQALGLTRAGTSISRDKYLSRRAYQVITAGAGDQPVVDSLSMSKLMAETLKQGNAFDGEYLTFSSLGLHLKETMASTEGLDQLPQFGHLQGSQGGEFILSANVGYWSLKPSADLIAVEPSPPPSTQSIPEGTYSAQVDLSGRIDDISSPTVVSISAGLSYSILLPVDEKHRALKLTAAFRPKLGVLRRRLLIFSLLLSHLIIDYVEKLDRIEIDNEYPGHDPSIKNLILQFLKGKASSHQLVFTKLDKGGLASQMASRVYKGEMRADWVITAEELLSPLK
jgi:hypothetical protein